MLKKTFLILSALTVGMFLRFYNLLYFHHMTADESVCTQAVFALTKGYLPYRDVFIAHPLAYFLIEYPFIRLFPSILMARSVSVLLSLGTMLLIFYITKDLYSENVAMLATALFAFSSYAIYYNKLAIVENAILFFTTLLLYFFFKYYRSDCERYLFLSGLIAGVAFISKYTAVFAIVVLMFLIAMKGLKKLAFFVAFASIAPLVFISSLFLFGVHYYWYIQTVSLQLIRFSLPLALKMSELGVYLAWTSPLLIMAIPVMIHRRAKEDTILTALYVIPFLVMCFGKVLFTHYFLMLTPMLCTLAARGLDQYFIRPKGLEFRKINAKVLVVLAILLVHFFFYSSIFLGSAQSEFAVHAKMEVADYIRSITEENDKIWTTEADIAFFAQRLIVAPNSTIWKYQGFYEDVWGYMGTSYVGQFAGYSGGLISLEEIRQALECEKPKVVVVMEYKVADMIIWNGINNPAYKEEGLADYILTHYYLEREIYDIQIYVRK